MRLMSEGNSSIPELALQNPNTKSVSWREMSSLRPRPGHGALDWEMTRCGLVD